MARFPYINFPFPYYNNRPLSAPYAIRHSDFRDTTPIVSSDSTSNSNRLENCKFEDKKNKSNSSNNDYLFDLFGLKIYTDDVLLVSLIYFLYSEGVKDEGLFIVLILLLLS